MTTTTPPPAVPLPASVDVSTEEACAILETILRGAADNGFPDGLTKEEIAVRYGVLADQLLDARLTLGFFELLMRGDLDMWPKDDGEVQCKLRHRPTTTERS